MSTQEKKELKSIALEGFDGYTVHEDGSVLDIATNKAVKAVKGIVKMKNNDKVEQAFEVKDLIALFEEVPDAEEEKTETDDRKVAPEGAEVKKELKTLRDELKNATNELLTVKRTDHEAVNKAHDRAEKALAALDAFKEAHNVSANGVMKGKGEKKKKEKTPDAPATAEQIEAQKVYDEKKVLYTEAKEALETALAHLRTFKKVRLGASGDHSPKLTYEDAQNIRLDYSIGRYGNEGEKMSVKDIADKYGISTTGVGDKINYLQFKLKKGDTAYTPLVNDYYPEEWTSKDGVKRSGAPYLEDAVKEDASKYTRKVNADEELAEA